MIRMMALAVGGARGGGGDSGSRESKPREIDWKMENLLLQNDDDGVDNALMDAMFPRFPAQVMKRSVW
ncbi:hypothetical protein Y032_0378g280 [Ancylostoma ceylanicum]|uniref:Uncharacterized protein n=1 Tax=Ancylostoma ceylanicum TaxID=53326 RepID=A0A016RTH9_9BILA|nr:hypothetical protein Y032_0378g280 [Ancylostoma ceylanicum]